MRDLYLFVTDVPTQFPLWPPQHWDRVSPVRDSDWIRSAAVRIVSNLYVLEFPTMRFLGPNPVWILISSITTCIESSIGHHMTYCCILFHEKTYDPWGAYALPLERHRAD